MLRMGLAPCAPFNVTNDLMVEAARLARRYAIPSSSAHAICHLCLQVTAQDTTLPAMYGQPSVPHSNCNQLDQCMHNNSRG